jgi:Domain of unknown function (DUF6378)
MVQRNKRADILKTAEELINGDRAQSYGPPEDSFTRIAELWSAMGMRVVSNNHGMVDTKGHPIFDERKIDATDVALALLQLKIARLTVSPAHEDSWVDVAGYAGLGGEISLSGIMKPGVVREDKESTARKPGFSSLSTGNYMCDRCHEVVSQKVLLDHAKNRHGFDEYVLL